MTTTFENLDDAATARAAADSFRTVHERIRTQVGRMMVGQDEIVEGVLTALFSGGHVLLEGVPGLGKTLLVRTLGQAVSLRFSRIQFTPDMMPADVRGTNVLVEDAHGGTRVEFQPGPLIANLVLADEINRATPKTQSALLESMQEKQVSVGTRTIVLDEPFCVMATQNPIEQEGTYPLPEAQLDRFLFKLLVGYPEEEQYRTILRRTTTTDGVAIEHVSSGEEIVALRRVVRSVPVPEHVETEAIRLVMATQPGGPYSPPVVNEVVSLGASPRGAQGLLLAGKVKALLAGRFAVAGEDLRAVAHPVLRHRILINFQGLSDGVTPDRIVDAVLDHVAPVHGERHREQRHDIYSLLDPVLIERARALRIVARRVAPGGRWADQRSLDRGAGLEFRDYRPYAPGDDLRAIDWNVYRRLGRVVIRLFEELEDLPIYLVPDFSGSMWQETPPRAEAALTAIVALAAIGLDQHDAVGVFPFGEDLEIAMRPRSGHGRLLEIAAALEQRAAEAGSGGSKGSSRTCTDLVNSLGRFRGLGLREGLVVIVSDFFDPAGAEAMLAGVNAFRHRLLLVPIVREGDRVPDLEGDLRLRDCETAATHDVSITRDVLERYTAAYDRFMRSLRDFARQRRGGFLPIDAGRDVLDQFAQLFEGGSYDV